jgi:hypothetical protein
VLCRGRFGCVSDGRGITETTPAALLAVQLSLLDVLYIGAR